MGLQFGLTARFRFVTKPWGEDVIYYFHRRISLFALALVVVHPLIMFSAHPELLAFPQGGEVPLGAVFAFLSVFALLTLVVTALWHAKLKIPYEMWHITHIALAIIAVTGGLLDMVGWSFYLVDPWKRSLWIALTIFWIALIFYVRIVKPLFMLRRHYRVQEVRREHGDTTTLVMRPDGHPGFRFRPGQFAWFTVWGSPFKITGHPSGSLWNRVGKFEGLKGHRARYFRDILHFCGVQNLAQMLDGKNIETSSAALGYVFI